MSHPSTTSRIPRIPVRLALLALTGLAVGAIAPLAQDWQGDGPDTPRPARATTIPAVAPTGYLIEGRYADPPIIRYVPQPVTGDLMLTRAMPSS